MNLMSAKLYTNIIKDGWLDWGMPTLGKTKATTCYRLSDE